MDKIKLEEVLDYIQPTKYIVHSTQYSDEYTTPVLTPGKSFILGYTNETDGIFYASKEPIILFDDFTGAIKYVDFDFKVKSSAIKILKKKTSSDNLKYIYLSMKTIDFKPFSHKRLWIQEFSKFQINKRTAEEQKKIVSYFDGIEKAIENRKKQISLLENLFSYKLTNIIN